MSKKRHAKAHGSSGQLNSNFAQDMFRNKPQAKSHGNRQHKREQFSQSAKGNYNWLMLVVIVALVAVIGYLVTSRLNQDPTTTVVSAKTIQLASGVSEARLPLSEVNDGKAKFYDATLSNGTSVRFFVVKTADGIYRTALDACQVCFDAHKGYYQDGNDMVCRKCGRHFPISSIGYGTSGCHPMGLHGTVDGDDLVIQTNELQNGSRYF